VRRHLIRVSRNASEEIFVSLQEVGGELFLELRIYRRAADHGEVFVPESEAILVPVRVLPDLCSALDQTRDRLMKEGLLRVQSPATVFPTQAGESATLCLGDPEADPVPTRPEPRREVGVPVQCHLLRAADTWPSKPLPEQVTGEIRDVSGGGAQAWLPEQFPISTHLAIFTRIGGMTFRAQAEVADVAPHPEEGKYRHTLQWLSLTENAQEVLAKLTGTRL